MKAAAKTLPPAPVARLGKSKPQRAATACSASAAPAVPAKLKPDWAGEDDLLSKFVNVLIRTKPLYAGMKVLAKRTLKRTAEGRGVPWEQNMQQLMSRLQELEAMRAEVEDPDLAYPSYYLQPFHAYAVGNLGWEPAVEVESATTAMALRVYKDEPSLEPHAAMDRMRGAITARIQEFRDEHGCGQPADVLDVGCSAGIGTRRLADDFPAAHVTGVDLSPYFLAVAEMRERQQPRMTAGEQLERRVTYRHALGEATGLPVSSVDLVTLQFVIHECPQRAIEALITEAQRLLRPGGTLAIVDNNPRSPVIQNLPPALYVLMKSTEPWSDEYYSFDVEKCMRVAGFGSVRTTESDPRHRVVLGLAR